MTQIVQSWRQLCDDVKQENKNRDDWGNPNKKTENTINSSDAIFSFFALGALRLAEGLKNHDVKYNYYYVKS